MSYRQTTQFLESFINYEKIPAWPYKESLKLERIKDFLAVIGDPHKQLRCVHVAGTKGKGSTCAFIAYILKESGFKTGLYTSPHLSDFRERIRILQGHKDTRTQRHKVDVFEGMISRQELTGLVDRLKPAIENYNKSSQYGPLSFFEVYTSLAFFYFKESNVDYVVLETGLGGRLDATNVVNSPVSVITPLSYEHTQKLGNTLTEIASEKAGIIKSSQLSALSSQPVVVSAPQEEEAMRVIRDRCLLAGAELRVVGRDITYEGINNDFKVKGIDNCYNGLKTGLIGAHQMLNAAAAIGAVEGLKANVGVDLIRKGLYNTIWPGRCEVVSIDPQIIVDGAQNSASARVIKEAVKKNFKYRKLFLILGVSNDKDIKGICAELYDLADAVILTRADNPRAADPAALAGGFEGKKIYFTGNVKQARDKAGQLAGKEDLILVCGSLFVVGEFRKFFIEYDIK